MGAFEFGLSDGCHCEQSCLSLFHKKTNIIMQKNLEMLKVLGYLFWELDLPKEGVFLGTLRYRIRPVEVSAPLSHSLGL